MCCGAQPVRGEAQRRFKGLEVAMRKQWIITRKGIPFFGRNGGEGIQHADFRTHMRLLYGVCRVAATATNVIPP